MFPLRDENPTHHFPIVTVALIVINVFAFFYEVAVGESVIKQMALFPAVITGVDLNLSTLPATTTFFTSMFLHGGIMHLLGNMWFLWIFGDNLEDSLGRFWYSIYYLLTGVAAGVVHVVMNPDLMVPTVGASGAISGVLGGYMVLHPRIRIKTLVTLGFFWNVTYIPAIFFLGIWFVMQLLGGLGGPSQVAFGAHVGGFLAGVIMIFLMTKRNTHLHARYENNRCRRF